MANLTATLLSVSNTNPDPGQTFTATFKISYTGGPGLTAYENVFVDAYQSTDQNINPNIDYGSGALAYIPGPTGPSFTTPVTVTLVARSAGTWYVGAYADYTDAIAETSETDNASNLIQITVGRNHAPVANDNSYSTNKNTALTISATGVLGNDTDADFNSLTAVLASNPSHGSVSLSSNGSFTYTPATNYTGADSFTYFANDGTVNSNTTATVSITVTSTPQPHVTPSVNVQNVSVAQNASIAASSMITSVSNPSNDLITAYEFIDQGAGGGFFQFGNTIKPANQWIEVLTTDLSSLQYVGGSSSGSESLAIAVYDYTTNSYSNFSTLTATTTATPSDLLVVGNNLSATTVTPGDNITFTYWVDNFGTGPAPASQTGIYLSTDSVITSSDVLLTIVNTPQLTTLSGSHGTDFESVGITIPGGLVAGQYFIGAIGDYNGQIAELSEINNASVGLAISVGQPLHPTPRDFNADGTSDVLWRNNSTGHLGIWQMKNSVQSWQDLGGSGVDHKVAGIGDFNRDGTADLFWRNDATGHVGTWEMHNNVPIWHDLGGSGVDHKVVGIGDFNGDGTSDVLWRNDGSGHTGFWEMHNNVQTWRDLGGSGVDHKVVGIGDFNGDGTSDVLWRNDGSGHTGFWEMHNNVQTWRDLGGSGVDHKVVGIGDFNGDGTSDVLWRNDASGHTGFWEMHNGVQTWRDLGGSGTDHKVAGIGDYSGDGTSDVFWRNDATGYTGFWEMHNNVPTWHDLGGSGIDHSFIV
jgi:VCBS repeat-containing protein